MTEKGGKLGGGGIEQKGLTDMDNSVAIAGGRVGVRGLNCNGKTIQ